MARYKLVVVDADKATRRAAALALRSVAIIGPRLSAPFRAWHVNDVTEEVNTFERGFHRATVRVGVTIDAPADLPEALAQALAHPRVQQVIAELPKRKKHQVWTVADTECPEGRTNCRNCGDPVFAEACRSAGHCPQCGVDHGMVPDRVVQAMGCKLEPAD